MMTGIDVDNKQSKRESALSELRFKKNRKAATTTLSNSSTMASSSSNNTSPPAQSRDGTVSSRFFSTTPSLGTVLVPSSSPIHVSTSSIPYQPFGQRQATDVATLPNLGRHLSQYSSSSSFGDPLSVPSGFKLNGKSVNEPTRHLSDASEDEERPRKRLNRGPSTTIDSPESPEIKRPGQRRRPRALGDDEMSSTSDDLPDVANIHDGPGKSRILRRPTSPLPPPAQPQSQSHRIDEERRYKAFSISLPGHRPHRVRAAYDEAGGDVSKASALVLDDNWQPRQSVAPNQDEEIKFKRFSITQPTETPARCKAAWMEAKGDVKIASALLADISWSPKTGHVKKAEISTKVNSFVDAHRAEREKQKEMARKSAIYGVHTETLGPAPTQSTSIINLTSSPVIAPKRKRLTRRVLDSDSECGFDSDMDVTPQKRSKPDSDASRAMHFFNIKDAEALQELTGCTLVQANTIISLRPYESIADLEAKLGQGKKKAGPSGISPRMFQDCTDIFEGYGAVDNLLGECEAIGISLNLTIASWTGAPSKGGEPEMAADDGALNLHSMESVKKDKIKSFTPTQPSSLAEGVKLKDYQLIGINWLHLLYRRNLSCILADEMGLGKTIQVISFFAHLKEKGSKGPHLIIVPSSTLENWVREFQRFAPGLRVQTYYAGKNDRVELRYTLASTTAANGRKDGWEVLITTYTLAQGESDRKFLRKIEWDCTVYDEGHVLKNFQSQRYQALLKIPSKWRLLLTGTPLQNNLQELVSLMNFILPEQFADSLESLRAIFKAKGDSKVTLLAQERVSRAKKMMTPFVLRRRKDQVLKDLPKKSERIEWCELSSSQKTIYVNAMQRSRKTVLEAPIEEHPPSAKSKAKKVRPKEKVYLENSSNVLMDLRKAASHPMLFRHRFDDDVLTGITRQLLKEPDFKKRGALFSIVKEDMSVMTDSELQFLCRSYKSTEKFLQDQECFIDSGKVVALLRLLEEYKQQDRKVLIFSQFTQILDILQVILQDSGYKFLLLTGSTPVDVRQSLVDEFTEDDSIPVFLLSTKAGGMGINLTAASVVIMFDQDFNPHNDRQAQDRAYRIGQKRDVEVVKLISRGTIEEDMLRLGETKLALDEAVAGDSEEKGDNAPEQEMKLSLMSALRKQFEEHQEAP